MVPYPPPAVNQTVWRQYSCIEVVEKDSLLVLDAGSGIQNINLSSNLHTDRVDILLTHLHIDHIQGLGFFRPLFNPAMEVHIWGPASNTQSLRTRISRYFSPPLFPVYFRDLTCKLFFHEIHNTIFEIGPFTIQSNYITHPGPTVGFRIQDSHSVFSYMPDHEPALGPNGLLRDVRWLSGSDLAMNADLLIHDAQYTTEEYQSKFGWGHSSMQHTLEYASITGVKHLLLTHHDPIRSDEQLNDLFKRMKESSSFEFQYEMAVEGSTYEL